MKEFFFKNLTFGVVKTYTYVAAKAPALEYHHTNYRVDNDSKKMRVASQNYINDFNHRFIVVHHFSAKF